MVKVVFETANFLFEAYGGSAKEAFTTLETAWHVHAAATGADADLLYKEYDDIRFVEVQAGWAFRDGERFE